MRNTLQVSHYELETELLIDSGEISGACRVIFSRIGKISSASFLLNKGLRVFSVKNEQGKDLSFKQNLKSFHDLNALRVNRILISFDEIRLNRKYSVSIKFGGRLIGYEDVFPYTKDRISKYFSLLRPDVFAYPLVGSLNFKRLIKTIVTQLFTYDLKVTVPRRYVVACGGKLLNKMHLDGKVVYKYTTYAPTWRIDVAVAKFKVVTKRKGTLKMYVFPEDLSNAKQVQEEIERAWLFFENWFGFSPKIKDYMLIEIPRGWGSQAGTNYMLLDEDSLKNRERIHGLYHELAHLWNVSSAEKFPSRFFDEGFASYFQALAERRFLGEWAFEKRMKAFQQTFSELCKKDSRFLETPMFRYGETGLTDASYSKGVWALYVLHKLLGDQKFKEIIRTFLKMHYKKPATVEDFRKHIKKIASKDFKEFFAEWFFGVQSSIYLVKGVSIDEIVAKYR
jgi:hypothetical protein